MVHLKAAFCSTLLAAGLASAIPVGGFTTDNHSLVQHEILPRGNVDPARIDAVRNRVNRPKKASGAELQPSGKGAKQSPLQDGKLNVSQSPPQKPLNPRPNPPRKPEGGNSVDKAIPKAGPKALNKNTAPNSQTHGQSQGQPIMRGSRPSYNRKHAGKEESPTPPSQPSKLNGGTTSQPNPRTSINRGGNNPRTGDPKDITQAKANRKARPTVSTGSNEQDDSTDGIKGAERVAKDAMEGSGAPHDRSTPSADVKHAVKAQKKPKTNNRQGSVGKGGQASPQTQRPMVKSGVTAVENGEIEGKDGEKNEGEDDYFEWFRASGYTPTEHVVKAKDGWKNKFALRGKDGKAENNKLKKPEGLEKLPMNQRHQTTDGGEVEKAQESKGNIEEPEQRSEN